MFSGIRQKIKEFFKKMAGSKTIEQALKINPVISEKMSFAIELWDLMYKDQAPWLKDSSYSDPVAIKSLGLPSFIASEKARVVTLEMTSEITAPAEVETSEGITVDSIKSTSNARADYLNEQYQEKVISKIRTQLEYGIAKGGFVIKPYYIPGNVDNGSKQVGQLEFDFVQADNFYPLGFDASGKITEAAFIQRKTDKDTVYTRLELHSLKGNSVVVRNKAYKSTNKNSDSLGDEIPLSSVPEWAAFQPKTVINNVDRLLFAYFKMPEANTIDTYSPLGVSGYSRAASLIEEADKQYSRMLWEFEGGELAIDIDCDALMEKDDGSGHPVITRPVMQQRLFRKVDLHNGDDSDTYSVFSPALRDASLINGLNNILKRIEDVCALARGTLTDPSNDGRTATEIKMLKARTYESVTDIQKSLQKTLEDVVYIMNVYCTLYNIVGDSPMDPKNGAPIPDNIGKYEVSFGWDDSILTDKDEQLNKMLLLEQIGVVSKLEIRMMYFGETEQQAKEALAKIDAENIEAVENDFEKQGVR